MIGEVEKGIEISEGVVAVALMGGSSGRVKRSEGMYKALPVVSEGDAEGDKEYKVGVVVIASSLLPKEGS